MLVPARLWQRHRPLDTGLRRYDGIERGLVGGGLVGWWAGGLVGWWAGGLVGWWAGGLVRQGSRDWLDFSSGADPHCATARRTPPQATPLVIPAQAESRNHARHRHTPLAARTTAMLVPVRLRQRHRPHWIPAFAGMTGLGVGLVGWVGWWAGGLVGWAAGRAGGLVGWWAGAPGVAGLGWISQQRRGPALHNSPQNTAASHPARHSGAGRNPETTPGTATPAGRPHHGHAGSRAPSAAPKAALDTGLRRYDGLSVVLVGGRDKGRGLGCISATARTRTAQQPAERRRKPPPLVIAAQAGIQKPRPAPPHPLAARTTAVLVPARLRQLQRPHWIPAFAGMTGLGVGWWADAARSRGLAGFQQRRDPHGTAARRTPPQAAPARHSGAGRNPETTPGGATARWPPAPRPCWFQCAFGNAIGRTGYRPSPV